MPQSNGGKRSSWEKQVVVWFVPTYVVVVSRIEEGGGGMESAFSLLLWAPIHQDRVG